MLSTLSFQQRSDLYTSITEYKSVQKYSMVTIYIAESPSNRFVVSHQGDIYDGYVCSVCPQS